MRPRLPIAVGALLLGASLGHALTPEDLRAGIEARTDAENPFTAALNDPDPARSRAAVALMLDSGDPALMRMASEFAIRSAEPALQRLGVEGVLSSKVPLTVVLDGSKLEDRAAFTAAVSTYHDGAVGPDGIAYISVAIGAFDPDKGCYLTGDERQCGASVNGDGLFLTQPHIQGRLGYSDDAMLVGAVSITGLAPSLPATLRIVE